MAAGVRGGVQGAGADGVLTAGAEGNADRAKLTSSLPRRSYASNPRPSTTPTTSLQAPYTRYYAARGATAAAYGSAGEEVRSQRSS